jgi:hypothetical protein
MPGPVDLLCDVVAEEDAQVVVVAPRWEVEADDGTTQFPRPTSHLSKPDLFAVN